VDLVSRVPGTVTLRRARGGGGRWVAVTATGREGGRLAGFRIESTPELPIDVGVRIVGQGRTLEMLDIVGPVDAGVEVAASSNVILQGSIVEAPSVAVRLGDGAHATLSHNVIARAGRADVPPLSLAGSAQVALSRNVLAGFGRTIADAPGAPLDLGGNFVLGAGATPKGAR
jgi:hypothetical protein